VKAVFAAPRLSGRSRLLAAAVLCLTPMGLAWTSVGGYLDGGILYGTDCGWVDGAYVCDAPIYQHGSYHPGVHVLVSQSPIGALLVVAAMALVVAALRGRTAATVQLARGGVVAVAAAAVVAGAHGVTTPLFAVLGALALSGPVVMQRRRSGRPS
jgi:hypothetical protein